MADNEDVLLLHDEMDTDMCDEDDCEYNIHRILNDDNLNKKDENRKTRASSQVSRSCSSVPIFTAEKIDKPSRIIKGTATKANVKAVKRKSTSKTSDKPQKVPKSQTYSEADINELKIKWALLLWLITYLT